MKSDSTPNVSLWEGCFRSVLFFLIFFVLAMVTWSSSALAWQDKTGTGGLYAELGGREGPDAFCGEIGAFGYVNNNLTLRAGLAMIASESFDDLFTGITTGARYAFDSPLTPFVGFGVFGGYSKETVSATNDGVDNNNNGLVDEWGESDSRISAVLLSAYPEVGVHLWAGDNMRMTFSGKYYVTTEGMDSNFWLFNFGLAMSFGE